MEVHPGHAIELRGVQAAHQNPMHVALCETACMLFWALLASGQITLREIDGCKTLHVAPPSKFLIWPHEPIS